MCKILPKISENLSHHFKPPYRVSSISSGRFFQSLISVVRNFPLLLLPKNQFSRQLMLVAFSYIFSNHLPRFDTEQARTYLIYRNFARIFFGFGPVYVTGEGVEDYANLKSDMINLNWANIFFRAIYLDVHRILMNFFFFFFFLTSYRFSLDDLRLVRYFLFKVILCIKEYRFFSLSLRQSEMIENHTCSSKKVLRYNWTC